MADAATAADEVKFLGIALARVVAAELEADRARVLSYFNAPMGREEPDGSRYIVTNVGHYRDDLVRTPEGWRIKHRKCEQIMMLGELPKGYQIPD